MTLPASDTVTPAAPPAPEPSAPQPVAVTEPVPEPTPAQPAPPSTELALPGSTELVAQEKWEHEWLDFNGDRLGIRIPTPQAMSGLSMALSKFTPPRVANDIYGLFVARHLSPATYERVYSRLFDPDDHEYNANTIGELIGKILDTGTEAFEQASKAALAAGDKPKG